MGTPSSGCSRVRRRPMALIGGIGLGQGVGGIVADEGVDVAVHFLDLIEAGLHGFAGGNFARGRVCAANCEMVSWFNMAGALLDNLRHQEKAVGAGGGVAQGFLVGERRADFVGAENIDQRHGVGGRFDAGSRPVR